MEDREMIERYKRSMQNLSSRRNDDSPPVIYPGVRNTNTAAQAVTLGTPTYSWLDDLRINTKISVFRALRTMQEKNAESNAEAV